MTHAQHFMRAVAQNCRVLGRYATSYTMPSARLLASGKWVRWEDAVPSIDDGGPVWGVFACGDVKVKVQRARNVGEGVSCVSWWWTEALIALGLYLRAEEGLVAVFLGAVG